MLKKVNNLNRILCTYATSTCDSKQEKNILKTRGKNYRGTSLKYVCSVCILMYTCDEI